MSQGKYSPYCKNPFVPDHWETGKLGTFEVDSDGFNTYGYNANGRDIMGLSEEDYLFMSDHEFEARCRCSAAQAYLNAGYQKFNLMEKICELALNEATSQSMCIRVQKQHD